MSLSTVPQKRKVKGARERILEKAQDLFYVQGFRNTGINQIISESGTAKASFYQYFKSKDDLALSYLKYYEDRIVNAMHRLMEKHDSMAGFFRAWTRVLNRDIKYMKSFNGCPFANFASQLDQDDKGPIADQVQIIIGRMYDHFEDYFNKCIKRGDLSGKQEARLLAKRILHIYQGGMMMAKISGDLSYVKDLEHLFLQALADP